VAEYTVEIHAENQRDLAIWWYNSYMTWICGLSKKITKEEEMFIQSKEEMETRSDR